MYFLVIDYRSVEGGGKDAESSLAPFFTVIVIEASEGRDSIGMEAG